MNNVHIKLTHSVLLTALLGITNALSLVASQAPQSLFYERQTQVTTLSGLPSATTAASATATNTTATAALAASVQTQSSSATSAASTSSITTARASSTYSGTPVAEYAEMKKFQAYCAQQNILEQEMKIGAESTRKPIKRLGENQQEIAEKIYSVIPDLPKELTELIARYSYEFRGICAIINGSSAFEGGTCGHFSSITPLPDGSLASIWGLNKIVFWSHVTDSQGQKKWTYSKVLAIPTLEITAVLPLPDGSVALGGLGTISICSAKADSKGQKNWACTKNIGINNLYEQITALILLPDGSFVSGSMFGRIKIWSPTTDSNGEKTWEYKPTPEQTFQGDPHIVQNLISLPDGSIASRCSCLDKSSGVAQVWSFNTDAQGKKAWTAQTLNGQNEDMRALVLLPNGSLASGNTEGDIKIWSPVPDSKGKTTWTSSQPINPTSQPIRTLMVLADGSLVSGEAAGCMSILSPATNANKQTIWSLSQILTEHVEDVEYMVELPSGYLASSDVSGIINVLSPSIDSEGKRAWERSHTFQGNGYKIIDLIGLPDGALAAGYKDSTIKIWR